MLPMTVILVKQVGSTSTYEAKARQSSPRLASATLQDIVQTKPTSKRKRNARQKPDRIPVQLNSRACFPSLNRTLISVSRAARRKATQKWAKYRNDMVKSDLSVRN